MRQEGDEKNSHRGSGSERRAGSSAIWGKLSTKVTIVERLGSLSGVEMRDGYSYCNRVVC